MNIKNCDNPQRGTFAKNRINQHTHTHADLRNATHDIMNVAVFNFATLAFADQRLQVPLAQSDSAI